MLTGRYRGFTGSAELRKLNREKEFMIEKQRMNETKDIKTDAWQMQSDKETIMCKHNWREIWNNLQLEIVWPFDRIIMLEQKSMRNITA